MIRTFVAIDLPGPVRDELADAAARLRCLGLDGRFVKTASLHLTLKFLGDVDEDRVAPIGDRLRTACGECPSFRLELGAWGAFPSPRRPKAVWIGVRGLPPLLDLHKAVERSLVAEGFRGEKRPFRPHLTLLRLKSARRIDLLPEWLETAPGPRNLSFAVDSVDLFRSHLSPDGAEYERLLRVPLGRAASRETDSLL